MEYEAVVIVYKSRRQLEDLLRFLPSDLPLVVVDNSYHQDPLHDLLEGRSKTRHLNSGGNNGFAMAADLAIRTSSYAYQVILNPDTRPTKATLDSLVSHLEEHPQHGTVGAALVDEHGRRQSGAGGWDPNVLRALAHSIGIHRLFHKSGLFTAPRRGELLEVDWVSGACMALRRDIFLEVGGFGDTYFIYAAAFELGKKERALGLKHVLRGDLEVLHLGGASSDHVPSRLMWQLRGRETARYIMENSPAWKAAITVRVLQLGFWARALAYLLVGRRHRVPEMLTYAKEILNPKPVPIPSSEPPQ